MVNEKIESIKTNILFVYLNKNDNSFQKSKK